jgi:hypothetical protein
LFAELAQQKAKNSTARGNNFSEKYIRWMAAIGW